MADTYLKCVSVFLVFRSSSLCELTSSIVVDAQGRFLVSASSNRGWHGESTRAVFIHDVKCIY